MSVAGSESDDQDIESDGDESLESAEELVGDSEDSFVEESNEEDFQEEDQKSAEVLEIANLKDQLLRSAAEFENLKRRTVRDVENAHKFGTEKLISDLFPVIDSLEKDLQQQKDGF